MAEKITFKKFGGRFLDKMKKFIKNLSEEITGKRNILTGKKFEKTHENIGAAITEHGNVQNYLNQGYLIISEGKEYISFKKPKKFNGFLFVLLLFLGFFPGILYIIYYASKSDGSITIKK